MVPALLLHVAVPLALHVAQHVVLCVQVALVVRVPRGPLRRFPEVRFVLQL